MNWKEFLKPSIGNVLLAIIFFAVFSLLIRSAVCFEGGITIGFPYSFYSICNDIGTNGIIAGNPIFEPIRFLEDLILWYFVSVILFSVYKMVKK
ncbi:MAG: hypothetical protein Q7S21_05850 [archaeon]|nr:hypothetical protein [archaeon]